MGALFRTPRVDAAAQQRQNQALLRQEQQLDDQQRQAAERERELAAQERGRRAASAGRFRGRALLLSGDETGVPGATMQDRLGA
jgi:hypothetical protein